ncbi:CvpA family protein [Sphingomonas endophytica]|uniref:Colicin V production protein n=1 Tax=Sphingomonas endophytica TaxID=869719 RepID=A0A147IA33_9SPHN|nr:CvpA family protein [Sphingomonas endophytica]KTT76721.1 colicin V production protein [Sphingomonas endophytica]
MDLQPLDIVVLVLVALTAIGGVRRGFVGEVLALFAWVAMIFALKILHLPLSKVLAGTIASVSGAAVLAFVILTGVTYLVSRLIVNAIASRTRTSVLGPIDRALGFGFGALKGLILASLAYLFLVLALDLTGGGPTRRPLWLKQARTYPLLAATSSAMADFVDRRRKGQPVFGPRTPPHTSSTSDPTS